MHRATNLFLDVRDFTVEGQSIDLRVAYIVLVNQGFYLQICLLDEFVTPKSVVSNTPGEIRVTGCMCILAELRMLLCHEQVPLSSVSPICLYVCAC